MTDKKAMRKRDKAHKAAKLHDTSELWRAFRKLRNNVVTILRQSKASFFGSLSSKLSSLKEFWSSVHSITKESRQVPQELRMNSSTETTSRGKATLLNAQFVSAFGNETSMKSVPQSALDDVSNEVPMLREVVCSDSEVFDELRKLRPDVTTGPVDISSVVLRSCAQSLCYPHTSLFNLSLSQGVVPDDWKISNVTPFYKSGETALMSNYRPISLLSLCSKILERIIHNKFMKHLVEHNLLLDRQFGFRPGSSTQEAILTAVNDWHDILEGGGSVACVFLDLSKAFNSLPHDLIVNSLLSVGVCGILHTWFVSYLTNRKQRVVLDGFSSDTVKVTSGVPQGSILGPLLYILAVDTINRLPISRNSSLACMLMT